MPAAEPGAVQRACALPVHRGQAHVPQATVPVVAVAARPRTLRDVRPLHPLLRTDRRGPVPRPVRAWRPAAGGGLRRRGIRVLLLRQHGSDLPGRRTDRRGLPLPGPAVRPGLLPERLRALRQWLRPAHRSPPWPGAASHGGQRSRGQRGVELRQGPLGIHLRHRAGPHHHADDPRRGRRPGARALVDRDRRGRPGARRRPRTHRRPDRRQADQRGRLRLRQVRAHCPAHQRRGLPGPAPQRRGGRLPREARGRPDSRRRRRDVHRPRDGPGRPARGLRPRGRIADRLPAAAAFRA